MLQRDLQHVGTKGEGHYSLQKRRVPLGREKEPMPHPPVFVAVCSVPCRGRRKAVKGLRVIIKR